MDENERRQPEGGIALTAHNHHSKDCGKPPDLDSRDYRVVSCWTNQHGEQSILTWDGKKIKLYGGDWGWDDVKDITNAKITKGDFMGNPYVSIGNIILGTDEAFWVAGCLVAIKHRNK